MKAFDAKTGAELWERTTGRVATWLAYSEEHDVLVASNKDGIDAYGGKDGAELWQKNEDGKGFGGHPESVWDKVIVWKDRVIDQRGPGFAYDLRTGDTIQRRDPITGESIPWEFTKSGHHCNYAIASPHLLTFRAADAGYCDIASGGTSRFKGFRSGCRNSLIPADGVLNAPNFAFGCTCGFSIFTSLALVHVPEADLWTYGALKPASGPVDRLGINFGAASDREDEQGTLWLDYPNVGGSSPTVAVKLIADSPEWFRLPSAQMSGEGWPWVAASGVKGVQAVTVPLVLGNPAQDAQERRYTVRLYFATPDDTPAGTDVFDVAIQGATVLADFDAAKEAGGARRAIVKEIAGVRADRELSIAFTPKKGRALICGVEVVREKD